MTNVTTTPSQATAIENVLIKGDLSKLNEGERVLYYKQVCESVGLNPLTRPLDYITLNGKLVLYAKRDATDQLRAIHGVSVEDLTESEREGVYIVTAKVRNRDGRSDIAKGAVNINGLKGDNLANALMKAETKAKRRATLSICGLGLLDETELETIPQAAISQPADDMVTEPNHDKNYKGNFANESLRNTYCKNAVAALEACESETALRTAFEQYRPKLQNLEASPNARDRMVAEEIIKAKNRQKAFIQQHQAVKAGMPQGFNDITEES